MLTIDDDESNENQSRAALHGNRRECAFLSVYICIRICFLMVAQMQCGVVCRSVSSKCVVETENKYIILKEADNPEKFDNKTLILRC